MNINLNKESGDRLFAADIDLMVEAINSKADTIVIASLEAEDQRLAALINTITGSTSNVDLSQYLKTVDANLSFQPKGTYLTALPTITWAMIQGKPNFDGYADANYVDEGYLAGVHYGYSKAESDAKYLSITGSTSFNQDFNYNSLINKPDLSVYVTDSNLNALLTSATDTFQVKGDYITVSGATALINGQGFIKLSDIPTIDLSGYLTITNASNTYQPKGNYITSVSWEQVSNKPTFVDSYSKIESDTKYLSTGYTLTQDFRYSSLIGAPTIVDSYSKIQSDGRYLPTGYTFVQDFNYNSLTNKPTDLISQSQLTAALTGYSTTGHTHTFTSLSGKPTTVAGYGITDAVSTTSQTTALALKANLNTTISAKTANYTLVVGDNGSMLTMNVASGNTLTVPTNANAAIPVGAMINIQQIGTGQTTVVPASGVTLNSVGGKTKMNTQFSMITLVKTATNVWALGGDLVL